MLGLTLISTSNHLWLEFYSDPESTGEGFKLVYSSKRLSCSQQVGPGFNSQMGRCLSERSLSFQCPQGFSFQIKVVFANWRLHLPNVKLHKYLIFWDAATPLVDLENKAIRYGSIGRAVQCVSDVVFPAELSSNKKRDAKQRQTRYRKVISHET